MKNHRFIFRLDDNIHKFIRTYAKKNKITMTDVITNSIKYFAECLIANEETEELKKEIERLKYENVILNFRLHEKEKQCQKKTN